MSPVPWFLGNEASLYCLASLCLGMVSSLMLCLPRMPPLISATHKHETYAFSLQARTSTASSGSECKQHGSAAASYPRNLEREAGV